MSLLKRNLKIGKYTSPQSGNKVFERYVIENLEDLKAFNKEYPIMNKERIQKLILEGEIVLFTDPHALSGHPTYCLETKPNAEPHVSNFNRVKE